MAHTWSPAARCPGWHVWHAAGQWHARREHWYRSSRGDGRLYTVRHSDAARLAQLVGWQAELDLRCLYPDWECGQLRSGRWAAQWKGSGGAAGRIVTAPGAASLAAALRDLDLGSTR